MAQRTILSDRRAVAWLRGPSVPHTPSDARIRQRLPTPAPGPGVRTRHSCLAVVVLDVDKLKGINDTFGHQVGDAVLVNLARLLVKHTRVTDIPARLGGDEFGVIMLETSKGAALALGERVQQALDASPIYEQDGRSIKLSVSVGVSGFPGSGESVDELLRSADTHMYAAKAAGHRGTDISSRTPSRSGPKP